MDYICLKKKLEEYDIVTFDVFDTLISRRLVHPADVFLAVELQSRSQGFPDCSFAADRKKAEQLAYENYGENAGFQQIYQVLAEQFSYTDKQCSILRNLEFETECRLAIPRVSMRKLLQELMEQGKRIILCSDMYLSSKEIQRLLTICGYPGNLEILVSSEQGGTKSSGVLWKKLFDQLPPNQKMIHVGDNDQADCRALKKLGREAVLIPSGYDRYQKSPLRDYLSPYEEKDMGCSLVLGWLINDACFNSPFEDEKASESAVSVWGGPAFSCFMDFLLQHRDASELLFVTREGYVLQKLYRRYCHCAGAEPQENTIFYASRAAAIAATITSEEDVLNAMRQPKFQGTLGSFTRSRLNFDLSEDPVLSKMEVELPAQQSQVFEKLKPYFQEIFQNGAQQKKAYQIYTEKLRSSNQPLTVVDVGYNGTIQYALSRILGEKVGGLYMFLKDGAYPRRIGCPCSGIAVPTSGIHPLYENLMFLEAVMQVPYGQLQKMKLQDGEAVPQFNADANFSEYIPAAQEQFCRFAEWIGSWKKSLGEELQLDFSLAEAIWVCLLKFRYLPQNLLDSFWLADEYSGTSCWKYQDSDQNWHGSTETIPLDFLLTKAGEHLSLKQKMKQFMKEHIPYYAYDWACDIWMKYIK